MVAMMIEDIRSIDTGTVYSATLLIVAMMIQDIRSIDTGTVYSATLLMVAMMIRISVALTLGQCIL